MDTLTVQPSAPKLEDISRVYGQEEGCDVIFKVGTDQESCWRLPAHISVLKNANPVFRAMFSDYFISSVQRLEKDAIHTVPVCDIDGKAFDNLLCFLYYETVTFQSVDTALATLFAGNKYDCPGLVQLCVEYLNANLSIVNILDILTNIKILCGNVQNLENFDRERQMRIQSEEQSSRSLGGEVRPRNIPNPVLQQDNDYHIERECSILLRNCLRFVDKEASAIMQSDGMEDLDSDTIRLILSRDSLDVPDENMVFSAILKWADKECKRKQLPLTPESKRFVLGESLFLPRYLTMTPQSFCSDTGPVLSGLFTKEEIDCLFKIVGMGQLPPDLSSPSSTPTHVALGVPPSIRPYFKTLLRKRSPVRSPLASTSLAAKKARKGFSFVEKLKNRKFCCKSFQIRSHSNNSSQMSSPANSNPSSPIRRSSSAISSARNNNNNMHPQQPKRMNVAVEKIIIFLACLFD